jgi:cytochrome c biogenesis protein CcmG/thiol:disulfide interchange protein DsbE
MTSRTATKHRSNGKQPPTPPKGGLPWIWIALGAFVVLAGVIAVVVSRGGGDSDAKASTAGLKQTRPVAITGTPLAELPDTGADPAVGKTIPEARGKGFDGKAVSITKDGRPKVLLFVAHWCPHCRREVPLIVDHLKTNPVPSGVDLITVATSTRSNLPNYPPSTWLDKAGWTGPVMADSAKYDAAQAFGLPGFPYFVAVDAKGKVVARTSGEISMTDFDGLVKSAQGGS